jgi:type IV secretion system protein TrbL
MAEKCGMLDAGCELKNWAAGLADDAISNLAKSIMEGMSQMVTTLSTFWVSMPTVNLISEDRTGVTPVVSTVNSQLWPWTLTLAVLAVIIGGIRMIWEQRGAPLKDLLRSLITLTVVSSLGVGVISILIIAADAFAAAIITRSTDGKGFAESMKVLVMTGQTGIGVFILIVLGLVGLIASLVQIVLMVVRSGMLVILAGILPTTAAFTNTEMGRQWFQKAVGWTIAFILYKPAAAIVYSVAFLLMGNTSGRDALVGSISGFTLMVVALFALPALMRFVTPMVGAAVASGSGAAAGAAVGAIATGAVSLGRSGSGRGNAAPTPASTSNTTNTETSESPKGSPGSSGPRGGGGQPTRGTTGPGGAGSTAGKAGTAAGPAATGPAGMAVATGVQVASMTSQAIKTTAQDSTGEGPSGSN